MSVPVITGIVAPTQCTVGQPFGVVVTAASGNPPQTFNLTAVATANATGETTAETVSVQVIDPIADAVTITLTTDDPQVTIVPGATPGEFTVTAS